MAEERKISDKDLIRVLGEYTEKAQRADRRNRQSLALAAALLSGGASVTAAVAFALSNHYDVPVVVFYFGVAVLVSTMLWSIPASLGHRQSVELAVWQLRRVYELASRREDLGVELDSGTRLELELRLSEAAFLLTDLEKFHKPEKFRQFTRIGKDSPFREIEPDLQWPPAQSMPAPKSSA